MKRVVRVCGLRVSIEVTGLELDPTWDLFGAVPEEPLEGEAALAIQVRASDDPQPPVVGEPTFFHGAVECRSEETQHRLTTPFSEVLVLDEGTRMEMRVLEGALVEPRWYVVVPLFIAFAVAMRYHGLFHLHAAAVVDPQGACTLIVGQSGAGKTTACIGYLEQGWSYLGDDACFLKLGESDEVEVYGIPKEFHLTEWTLRRFPRLQALCGPVVASTGKRGLDPRRGWPPCRALCNAGAVTRWFATNHPGATDRCVGDSQADALGRLYESSALSAIGGEAHAVSVLALFAKLFRAPIRR